MSDIIFLRQRPYSTPDTLVNGLRWEIKSPLGGGKKTIENNMRTAREQSKNLIMDFSRMKLHQSKALANLRFCLKNAPNEFERVIVIMKSGGIIEIL